MLRSGLALYLNERKSERPNVRNGSWLRENVEMQRTHRRRFPRTAIEVIKLSLRRFHTARVKGGRRALA
jgi:hypothetical protein